jgi:transcription antitermination factor NusG
VALSIELKVQIGSKWVVVGLTSIGEKEKDVKVLTNSVHYILGKEIEVFVPAVSRKARVDTHTLFYMSGYVFLKFQDGIQYTKLQGTNYFEHVLCSGEGSKIRYALLNDKDLEPLRDGVTNISKCRFEIGDKVRVCKGEFKDLRGLVRMIHEGNETVQVDASQRSKPLLIDFPVIYLEKVDD